MIQKLSQEAKTPDPTILVPKAALKAADEMGVPAKTLARALGVSETTVSRWKSEKTPIKVDSKEFELAIMFIRLFRSLDAIAGGDRQTTRTWMTGHNSVLGGKPIDMIQTISGLFNVVAYLDSRRAIV